MTSENGSAVEGLPPRPRFFEGQLVRHGDLEAGESHALARHRRHALRLHGCGVVCGLLVDLEVDPESGEQVLVVGPGFAVDGAGNELELGEATGARLGEIRYLTGSGEERAPGRWPPDGGDVCALGPLADQRYYLALCHAEEAFCPVPAYPHECGGTLRTEPARRQDRSHLVLLDALGDADCVRRNPRLEDPDWIASYYLFEPTGAGPPQLPADAEPELARAEPVLSRRWSAAQPPAEGMRDSNLLVAWRRRVYLNAGRYRFRLQSDGGARLRVDGELIIDDWASGANRSRTADLILPPGAHAIQAEYFHETGAAVVDLLWQPLETGWHARFHPYPEQDEPPDIPTGAPAATWIEPALAIQLEGSERLRGGPDRHDHFILRLVRDIEITAPGLYAFTAHTDDGMRIRVDGEPVLDEWRPQSPTRYEPRVMLGPGAHRVEVDFFQRRGFAVAKLGWRRVGPYNTTCHPPRLPGCVVLAGFDVRAGAIRPETLQNLALDVAQGFERAVLPSAEVLGRAIVALGSDDPRPALAGIVPGRAQQGETVSAVVLGHGVGGASRLRFQSAGTTATVLGGGGDGWLPVRIAVAEDAAPGPQAFALDTPWCRVESADFGLAFEIESPPPPTASPTITVPPTFGPTFLPTLFTLAPSFFTLAPSLFTLAPSLFTAFTRPPVGPTFFSFFSLAPGGPVRVTGEPVQPPFTSLPTDFLPGGGGVLIGGDLLVDPARGEVPIGGLGDLTADERARLAAGGLGTVGALAGSQPDRIVDLLGVSPVRALELVELARARISLRPAETAAGNRPVSDLGGIGPAFSERLESGGIRTLGALALSDPPTVARLLGVSERRALDLLDKARARLFENRP